MARTAGKKLQASSFKLQGNSRGEATSRKPQAQIEQTGEEAESHELPGTAGGSGKVKVESEKPCWAVTH